MVVLQDLLTLVYLLVIPVTLAYYVVNPGENWMILVAGVAIGISSLMRVIDLMTFYYKILLNARIVYVRKQDLDKLGGTPGEGSDV